MLTSYQMDTEAHLEQTQEQTPGGKKRPSDLNPLGTLYIVLGTIRAKNKKNRLGNKAFLAK